MHTCIRNGLRHLNGNILHLHVGNNVWGEAIWEEFQVVKAPKHLDAAYRGMLRRTDLVHAPKLYVVESAHGAGGFFTPGVIVLGLEDAQRIARDLWYQQGSRLRAEIVAYLRSHGERTTDPLAVLEAAVMGRILAHELGHALVYVGYSTPYNHPEAAADYLSGRLDAARGRPDVIGEAIFRAIGCRELVCTHPSPAGRAQAYMSGYRDQRFIAA